MSKFTEVQKVLKAFSSTTRLEILDCIRQGVANPGLIAKKMNLHRSTIEKHLRVLLAGKVVKKKPIITDKSYISLTYEFENRAQILFNAIKDLMKE